jgi:hypothetical protein
VLGAPVSTRVAVAVGTVLSFTLAADWAETIYIMLAAALPTYWAITITVVHTTKFVIVLVHENPPRCSGSFVKRFVDSASSEPMQQ